MISAFRICGFKCFDDVRIDLGQMTVLTGINGAGKSSFIQALLLAHLATRGSDDIPLNGPLELRLGQALDVVRGSRIELTAYSGDADLATWSLSASADDALTLSVEERASAEQLPSELGRDLRYLQAERLGPRDVSPMDSSPEDELNVGVQGEFVAHLLAGRTRRVRKELRHPDSDLEALDKQTEAWMQELVPGIEIRGELFPSLCAAAIRLKKAGQATDWLRAQNIGFGVSYVLPVIVAGLVAKKGSMIIVENPEAHLHPQGQSLVARFLARVAMSGVQVVVETHSDHFLNGLRLSVVDDQHPLQVESVRLVHFNMDKGELAIQPIGITAKGGLTAAPAGFFDQSEKDLAAMLRVRRRV